MRKHVYFVRHGESNSNVDGIHRGSEAVLTETGRRQADVVARRMQDVGIDALIASPFPRAVQTAEAIAATCGMIIQENELFGERRRPSAVVGKARDDADIRSIMHDVFIGYASGDHRHSDEENFNDLKARAESALEFLEQYESERICVVTHGLFMRVLAIAALKSDFDGKDLQAALTGFRTSNTGISHFVLVDDSDHGGARWQIEQWNDSAHLGNLHD
jgi:2,3-bisphosphoglycerate-dependent phosphoglycerate mutase